MACHVALDAYDTTRRALARVAAPALAQRPAQAVGRDRVAGP
jgi:hypothetical protein